MNNNKYYKDLNNLVGKDVMISIANGKFTVISSGRLSKMSDECYRISDGKSIIYFTLDSITLINYDSIHI